MKRFFTVWGALAVSGVLNTASIITMAMAGLMTALIISPMARAETTPAELPTLVKASYKIYKGSLLIGQNDEVFERKGMRYTITSDAHAEGPLAIFFKERILYKSEGLIGPQGLQPAAFEQVRADASRSTYAKFDWDKKDIVSLRNGNTETFDLPDGTQDRLSSMYQFMLAVPRTSQLTVWMSQGKRSEKYVYQKQGEPTIKTPIGDFATVFYSRDAKEGESKSQLWLAKNKFHLPVRIIFEDKNGAFEQVLASLSVQ